MESGFLKAKLKRKKFTRRRFLFTLLVTTPGMAVADARWIEPGWLKVRRLRLTKGKPTHRFVQFTDLHHKGNVRYARRVVDRINALSPDFVCFTGDLVEDARFVREALEILSGIRAPVYGVPGNHDYWSRAPFGEIDKCFTATGGGWLLDEARVIAGGKIQLIGASCVNALRPLPPLKVDAKNILLMHYPAWVKNLRSGNYDLMLAGHSHGGQVRIPFLGPLMVPFMVDQYDMGLFQTSAGPLYVNAGIGWFPVPLRFNCRPEITLIEM